MLDADGRRDRRRHGAERGDDRDDDGAGQSFDHGVVAQPPQCVAACGDVGLLQKLRGQPERLTAAIATIPRNNAILIRSSRP